MDCSKRGGGGSAENPSLDQNPSPNSPAAAGGDDVLAAAAAVAKRPFTSLSQEEADLALARVLQEQEQAYMMLSVHGGEGNEYAASDSGSYDEEEEGLEGDEGSDYEEDEEGALHEDEEVGDTEGAPPGGGTPMAPRGSTSMQTVSLGGKNTGGERTPGRKNNGIRS